MMLIGAKCERCGCSDSDACMTAEGPCHWASVDPPICSACIEMEAEAPAPENCPAAASGYHRPFFRADNSAFCLHCRVELDVPEAA